MAMVAPLTAAWQGHGDTIGINMARPWWHQWSQCDKDMVAPLVAP